MSAPRTDKRPASDGGSDWLAVVKARVAGISYGVVQIIVHDGRVTQIECTERTRLDAPAGGGSGARSSGR
jgi:hypothetical protein